MAYLLLYSYVFLELPWCRYLRICYQSSYSTLLYTGLNTTAVHGHAALFGVYGILGIGLILFVLRGLYPDRHWNGKLLAWAFWLINIGLLVMLVGSLLPVGILQAIEAIQNGYWSARSEAFMQSEHMQSFAGCVSQVTCSWLLVNCYWCTSSSVCKQVGR